MRRRRFLETIGAIGAAVFVPFRRRLLAVVEVPTDAASIQEGIALAKNGGTVRVRPGTYYLDRPIEIGRKDLTLESTDCPSKTRLVARHDGAVFRCYGYGQRVMVRGFMFDFTDPDMRASAVMESGGGALGCRP